MTSLRAHSRVLVPRGCHDERGEGGDLPATRFTLPLPPSHQEKREVVHAAQDDAAPGGRQLHLIHRLQFRLDHERVDTQATQDLKERRTKSGDERAPWACRDEYRQQRAVVHDEDDRAAGVYASGLGTLRMSPSTLYCTHVPHWRYLPSPSQSRPPGRPHQVRRALARHEGEHPGHVLGHRCVWPGRRAGRHPRFIAPALLPRRLTFGDAHDHRS